MLSIFIESTANQLPLQKNQVTTEEYDKTISYKEIIVKINDVNIKNKGNKRVRKIVKEYQYNVSDDDSKNSARKKALNQVKILILEEIGVFVESYLEMDTTVSNKQYKRFFRQEIKNLTAGIIKTKILDERYDGKTYYVKASILVDPDSVSEGISEILKMKANKNEISKLNLLLIEKKNELDIRSVKTIQLQKQITTQELINIAKEKELQLIQKDLNRAQKKLYKYEKEEIKLKEKLSIIEKKVNKAYDKNINYLNKQKKKACSMKRKLSHQDVFDIIGVPDYYRYKVGGTMHKSSKNGNKLWKKSGAHTYRIYYYGKVRLYFNDFGQLSDISNCR